MSDPFEVWKYRRVSYPLKVNTIFDCRFHGAGEQMVQGRFQKFLHAFHDLSEGFGTKDRKACVQWPLTEAQVDAVNIMGEFRPDPPDPTQASVRLMRHASTIAGRVSEEIGRPVTSSSIRRMGLGDQIVLIGVIKAIRDHLGPLSVSVIYDELYPGSKALFSMVDFEAVSLDFDTQIIPGINCLPDTSVIPCRRHMLEHPICDGVPCYYGEEYSDPARQVLWNWGQEDRITGHRVADPVLMPSPDDIHGGHVVMGNFVPYIACQPLELTRRNEHATPESYSAVIQMLINRGAPSNVVFGCSPDERESLEDFVRRIQLPKAVKTRIVTAKLGVWLAILTEAAHMITGNTSGMWLGFSAKCPMTILGRSSSNHGTMWHPNRSWFSDEAWGITEILA